MNIIVILTVSVINADSFLLFLNIGNFIREVLGDWGDGVLQGPFHFASP